MDSGSTERLVENHNNENGLGADDLRRGREERAAEIRRQHIAERQYFSVSDSDGGDSDGGDSDDDSSIAIHPEVIQAVFSDDPARQLVATKMLRKLTSNGDARPINRIIACGVVPRFVEFLAGPHGALQFKAAWALTNIAAGTAEQTMVVINSGAVPHFISLLSSPILDVQDQAVWALGNIAGDCPMCRDIVLQAGALRPLLALLSEQHDNRMLHSATWTLSNFCRGEQPRPDWDLISPTLTPLSKLIHSRDDGVLIDACWAISYLSKDRIQAVIEAGVVPRLVELLNHRSSSVQTPALRSVGNLVTGDNPQTQIVIAAGALPALLTVLTSPKDTIRKVACWTISNITAGPPPQIQAVIEANLIPPLINILANSPDLMIRKEACWAISNLTCGGLQEPSQIRYLVQQGCIKPLCDMLTVMDDRSIQLPFDAIKNILKVGERDRLAAGAGAVNQYAIDVEDAGGMATIHELETRKNMEINETLRNLSIRTGDPGFS